MKKILALVFPAMLFASPVLAATVTGTFAAGVSGISATTFSPGANVPFEVTIAPDQFGGISSLSGGFELVRSQDGVNFAPVSPMIQSISPKSYVFNGPISFDVTEQRSGVTYAIVAVGGSSSPVTFRFDQ